MIVPAYYEEFQCVADACRHNCCIGWKIDIDEETAARYQKIPGNWETACAVKLRETRRILFWMTRAAVPA